MGQNQSQLNSFFQNYSGLVGLGNFNMSEMSQEGQISPQLYPQIVQSIGFQHQLLADTVYFADKDSSLTLYSYFQNSDEPFWSGWLNFDDSEPERTTKALPSSLQQQLNSAEISSVTEEELEIIKSLRERIDLEFETGTGAMRVTARMPDALAAAQVCNSAIKLLTLHLKQYRTQKARDVLDFAEEQYEIGRKRFIEARDRLARFEDQNVNLSTSKAQSRLEYLEAERDLAFNVYNSVAQKRIQARMNLQENTPVFKTVQAANVPLHKDSPRRMLIIILAIILGILVSFLIIAGKIIYANLSNKPI